MLIEFLNNQVVIDKVPLIENFRMNVQPETRQLRVKATYLGVVKTPVDLVVYKWTPGIDKFKLAISVNGIEMVSNNKFDVKIYFDIIKRKVKIMGSINNNPIEYDIHNIKEFMEIPYKLSSLIN